MQRRKAVISRLVYNAGKLNTVVSSLVFPCFVVCLWGSCWTCVLACCAAEIALSYLSLESERYHVHRTLHTSSLGTVFFFLFFSFHSFTAGLACRIV